MTRGRWRTRNPAVVLGVMFVLAVAFGGLAPTPAHAVVPISDDSPNPDGGDENDPLAVTACNGAPQTGVVYRHSESEPHLAVNPLNPASMIAGWHQDRWSTGGAQSLGAAYTTDGGQTWSQVTIPFTRCSGAAPGSGGDYERGTDPWITFSPDGTAHYMALVFDDSINANAMVVSRSTDGGRTWSTPSVIWRNPAADAVKASLLHDKNSITADPEDSRLLYAGWTTFRTGVTSLMFTRSTDGGLTWSPAIPIATMGTVAGAERTTFRQGSQIVALPGGTLVNAFYRILFDPVTGAVRYEQAILRSLDHGKRWSRIDTTVASFDDVHAFDFELDIPVRDANGLPSIAGNLATGRLYIAWQSRNADTGVSNVYVARSDDQGATWSAPAPANRGAPGSVQSFLPVVAVNGDGTVGVLFYDFRRDVSGDASLSTDVHLSLFGSDLTYMGEHTLTPQSFDLRQMVLAGPRGYFPGDYVGLAAAGKDFVAAFTVSNALGLPVVFPQNNDGVFVDSNDRQSIVFVRQTP